MGELVIAPIAPEPITIVQLLAPQVERGSRASDRAGLIMGLLELGLTDLDGVVPQVGTTPLSPGLQHAIPGGAELWVGTVDVPSWTPLRLSLRLCDGDEECVTHEAEVGSVEDPSPAVAALLGAVAVRLVLPVPTQNAWSSPGSTDLYAVLLAGRSASILYGLRDPAPPELIGDKRRDPVERAVYVDPGLPLAGWIAGRRASMRGEHVTARSWFGRAEVRRPQSLVLLADEAAAMGAEGKPKLAWALWQLVERRSPNDLRYAVAVARGALEAGLPDEAWSRLEALPASLYLDPRVAALRVSVAEVRGREPAYDELLATWEIADPGNPEPTRRRIRLRVLQERYSDAFELVERLRARGVPQEADALAVALLASLERWEEAAERAAALGDAPAAARIRARAALQTDADADVSPLVDDLSVPARLVLARSALRAGRGADADTLARAVLSVLPADIGALEIVAGSQELAGRAVDARATRARIALLQPPAVPVVGPSTAPGATTTGSQSHAPSE